MYTLRKHSSKQTKILTFTKKSMKKLLSVHPKAMAVFVYKLKQSFKQLDGTTILLNWDQQTMFNDRLNSLEGWKNVNVHLIDKWTMDGMRFLDQKMEDHLDTLDFFYKMLYEKNVNPTEN